jgi:flavin-binding protein dodecin
VNDGVAVDAAVDTAKTTINTMTLMQHIVERRIEVLLGTLIAYQVGLLDSLVSAGQSCIA